MKYEFIPARWHGGHQDDIVRIVMHSTVTPCADGWAKRVADMFHTSSRVASAHYVVDPSTIIKCLHDGTIGYGAPPNTGSIHVELCDWSRGDQWHGDNHQKMLKRAAQLVADKCHAYNLPIRHVYGHDLKAEQKGICSHLNITNQWHQTTHTDPEDFPWPMFLDMVTDAAGPKPKPANNDDGPPYPGHLLKRGSRGHAVKQVQTELNDRAVHADRLAVDGIYGPKTEKRVHGFQHHHHLAADGIVGPHTWKALFG